MPETGPPPAPAAAEATPAAAGAPALPRVRSRVRRRRRRRLPWYRRLWRAVWPQGWRQQAAAVLGLLLCTAVLAAFVGALRQPEPPTIAVGPYRMEIAEHYEGDLLPPQHRLREVANTGSLQLASDDSGPPLQLRRWCSWADPGRNPYRGTVEEALQSAHLPPEVIKAVALAVHEGRSTDRLTITPASIQAQGDGRRWSARAFAMTYGRTLCLGTRVNFRPGHSEAASLYEAADRRGRRYAVMVPDVCGNVSVLSAEEDLAPLAPAETEVQSQEADAPGALAPQRNGGGGVVATPRPRSGVASFSMPLPGSLWLVGLALAGVVATTVIRAVRRR